MGWGRAGVAPPMAADSDCGCWKPEKPEVAAAAAAVVTQELRERLSEALKAEAARQSSRSGNSPPGAAHLRSHHHHHQRLTSAVRHVSILAQHLVVSGVGPDGRAGVRVLVDEVLHTLPAAEARDTATT